MEFEMTSAAVRDRPLRRLAIKTDGRSKKRFEDPSILGLFRVSSDPVENRLQISWQGVKGLGAFRVNHVFLVAPRRDSCDWTGGRKVTFPTSMPGWRLSFSTGP